MDYYNRSALDSLDRIAVELGHLGTIAEELQHMRELLGRLQEAVEFLERSRIKHKPFHEPEVWE